jgi:hypothetical protein
MEDDIKAVVAALQEAEKKAAPKKPAAQGHPFLQNIEMRDIKLDPTLGAFLERYIDGGARGRAKKKRGKK